MTFQLHELFRNTGIMLDEARVEQHNLSKSDNLNLTFIIRKHVWVTFHPNINRSENKYVCTFDFKVYIVASLIVRFFPEKYIKMGMKVYFTLLKNTTS